MRILIKNTPTLGRKPTGKELRVYAVDDDGRNPAPMLGVRAVAINSVGHGPVVATLTIDALVDVEATLADGNAIPELIPGPEDTTAVGKAPTDRAGADRGKR